MENFLKWRVQLFEKGIKELKFTPRGTSAILHINDLKNIPLLKKEMRDAVHDVIGLLKDNYLELMVKNVSSQDFLPLKPKNKFVKGCNTIRVPSYIPRKEMLLEPISAAGNRVTCPSFRVTFDFSMG